MTIIGYSTVYPTGATIYNPEKCWNGYTVFPAVKMGAVLIDMNGCAVKLWERLEGFPNKVLHGGFVRGITGVRKAAFGYQDIVDLVQVDWDERYTFPA